MIPSARFIEQLSTQLMTPAVTDRCEPAGVRNVGCPGPLPDPHRVVRLTRQLRTLLFPELSGPGDGDAVRRRTSVSLHRIAAELQRKIGIALAAEAASKHGLRVVRSPGSGYPAVGESEMDAVQFEAGRIVDEFLRHLVELQSILRTDVEAAYNGDPAARDLREIILCYPGLEAVFVYRVAHFLQRAGVPYLPRILTEWAHRETGIDIHPGAQIGPSFFIDHGTGVVIGETCQIGSGVKLYQGVTLGAWSFPRDESGELIRGTKRHPTLEDNVVVYSNASILGGRTTVGRGSQVGSGVTLSRTVPPNTIVTIEQPTLRFREAV